MIIFLLGVIAYLLGSILYLLFKQLKFLEKKENERKERIENYLYKIWEELYKISYLSKTPEYKKMSKNDKENLIIQAGFERTDYKEYVEKYIEENT